MCFLCFPPSCVVLLVRPDGGVPVGGMKVFAVETLIQACVRDWLSGVVTHQQVSASHVPSQFVVTSIAVSGSSVEIVLPGGGRGCQPQTPRSPRVAKERKRAKKLARSC